MEPMSGQLHGPMVVAMIAMRVMKPSVHQVIDMITVRGRLRVRSSDHAHGLSTGFRGVQCMEFVALIAMTCSST